MYQVKEKKELPYISVQCGLPRQLTQDAIVIIGVIINAEKNMYSFFYESQKNHTCQYHLSQRKASMRYRSGSDPIVVFFFGACESDLYFVSRIKFFYKDKIAFL